MNKIKRLNKNSILEISQKAGDYETSLNEDKKSYFGIYYTPQKLVKFMLDLVEVNSTDKILEPGCGTGNFVIPLIERLKHTNNRFLDNLFAIDSDETAIKILISRVGESKNIISASFLSNSQIDKQSYDLIIGNPPYGAKLSKIEKEYCKYKYSQISGKNLRTESLFLIKAITLLKPGGTLCFLLPNTILRVNTYSRIRSFIKKTCSIEKIIDIDRAFKFVGYEMIILVLRKLPYETNNDIEVITNIKDFEKKVYSIHYLSKDFVNKRDIIPIYLSNQLISLINKIETKSTKLKDISKSIYRGIPISASKTKTYLKANEGGYLPVLRGRDIDKYKIKQITTYIKATPKLKKYIKNLTGEKLLIQNLAYHIVATYDKKNQIVLDTINILKLKNGFDYKYILGIINSELMEFYFKTMVTNNAALNIHLDLPYLGEIPIRTTNSIEKNKIIKLVDSLLNKNENDLKPYGKLNKEVYKLYNIEDTEIVKIKNFLGKSYGI